MAPIPVYTNSPINAAKAAGVTPQTVAHDNAPEHQDASTTPSKTRPAPGGYPPAQPGAVASLPAPTGSVQAGRYAPLQPTPTQQLADQSPPHPQPGAAPVPPSSNILPPPPRAGEQYHPPEPTPAPQAPSVGYPPQMGLSVQPPPLSQRGTSTAAAPLYSLPQPLAPGGEYGGQVNATTISPSHPPGYQQNVNAVDFTNQQRVAQSTQIELEQHRGGASQSPYEGAGDDGVWNSARKWAQTAGDKIAAAESEVWRRINKE